MKQFRVAIARTETVMYYFNVEAEDSGVAEELACDRYNENDYDSKDTIWGEDDVHEIKVIKDDN
jgi:hypothetical protein